MYALSILAGMATDDHAIGVNDDRLAKAELTDTRGNGRDSIIVDAGIARIAQPIATSSPMRPRFGVSRSSIVPERSRSFFASSPMLGRFRGRQLRLANGTKSLPMERPRKCRVSRPEELIAARRQS